MEKKYEIYGLKDPLTNEIMYVGLSTNTYNRYRSHIYEATNRTGEKYDWINHLISLNMKPEIIIFEIIITNDRKKAQNVESQYIQKYPQSFNKNQKDINKKIYAGYNIETDLLDNFKVTANLKKEKMSELVEGWIYDYIIKNKAEVNELIITLKNK